MHHGSTDHYWANKYRSNSFFVPSYLVGSSYIQKLEEAHRAHAAQKDAQQGAASGSTSQNGHTSIPGSKQATASHRGMTIDVIERAPTFDHDEATGARRDRCPGLLGVTPTEPGNAALAITDTPT